MENIKTFVAKNAENENINPNNPHWNWLTAIGFWFLSVVFILILPNISVFIYAISKGVDLTDKSQLTSLIENDVMATLYGILSIIPAHIFTIILAWIVITKLGKVSFTKALGWKMNKFSIWDGLIFLGIFIVLSVIVGSIFGEQDNDLLKILRSSRMAVYAVAFMATFTAPLVEEVVYRGILYSSFQKSFGEIYAVIITTFLFALVHVPQYYPSIATILMICLLSLVLTLIRAKTANLLPCIILHTLINGFQSAILLLEPYLHSNVEPSQATILGFFK
jgi:membrane protease YdiL (CAAX protease family)